MPPAVSPRNDVWETSSEIPYWWHVTTQIWVVLLIGWIKFPTNQRHCPDLASDTSSVWNFCTHFSDVILRGNHPWSRDMSAVFSGCKNPRFVNFLFPCARVASSLAVHAAVLIISCACYLHRSQEIAFRYQGTFNLHAFIVPEGSNRSRRSETKRSLGDRLYTNAKYLQTGPRADQQRNW